MDALEYAKQLIRFPSVSSESNVDITEHVAQILIGLGFELERLEYNDPRGVKKACVLGRRGPTGKPGLAFFGHTDVVPVLSWFTDDFDAYDPTVVDGRLYGRGSCDMKGPVACALSAAEAIDATSQTEPLYIICTADEEAGYLGAKEIAKRSTMFAEMRTNQTPGIITEPTLLDVVHAHKGSYLMEAISRGKSAHSSTRDGVNANWAMIPFLAEMKAIYEETQSDPNWRNDDFDPPTICMNIGINDNTPATNITPPQSRCTVNFRPMPGQSAEVIIDRARAKAEELDIEFHLHVGAGPLYVDPKSEFVQSVLQVAGKDESKTVGFGTDGAALTGLDNMVVFGPGSIEQAHKRDEFIALDELEKGTAVYGQLIEHFCCGA